MEETIVELRNISKRFPGVLALDQVDFSLSRGTIHALAGENGAGKSTLVKILSGVFSVYDGEIFLDGEHINFQNENDALDAGISIVHQELNPIPELTVEENIFIGREPERFKGILDFKTRHEEARRLLSYLGLDYDPKIKMKFLSVAQRQMVEIIKAISRDARIIIMDEPTSALSPHETNLLFSQIKNLQSENITFIYISHKLEEIFEICDCVTVLRDGKHIATNPINDVTSDEVIKMMVGREINQIYPSIPLPKGDELLQVKNYSSKGVFEDISFTVNKGEVFGIAGMMGSGRSELVRSIFGLDSHTSGELVLEGKSIQITKPRDAIECGIGMVTEDRAEHGFVPMLSISDNVVLPNCEIFAPKGILKNRLIRKTVKDVVDSISLRYPRLESLVMFLSGGNQQKVVLAKWLVRNMKLLIMDEPTMGIDVGSKQEIYELMKEFTQMGMGVIFISSEMPELISLCHRMIVLADGRIKGELQKDQISQDAIMKLIVNGEEK